MIDVHTQDACRMDRRIVRVLAEARQREQAGEDFTEVLRDTLKKLEELSQ